MLSVCRDDLEYLSVLASLPAEQTIFEYLVGCWKRGNKVRSELLKKVSGDCAGLRGRKTRPCIGIPPSRDSASRESLGQASGTCDQLHWADITRTGNVPPTVEVGGSSLSLFAHSRATQSRGWTCRTCHPSPITLLTLGTTPLNTHILT